MSNEMVSYGFTFLLGMFLTGTFMVTISHLDDKYIYNKGFEDGFKKGKNDKSVQ